MPSHLSWVDFAEDDRRRMLDVISALSDRDTVDELGLGTVRNAFADRFVPGTSTIQTRARYMLFVPWTYLIIEDKGLSGERARDEARKIEIRTIEALSNSEDTDGLIGKEARAKLQRFPSSIYWGGLGSWGIRRFFGSQSQYYASLDSFYRRKQDTLRRQDDEGLVIPNWDLALPSAPDKFPGDELSLLLTWEEAAYLTDRLRLSHPESLICILLGADRPPSTAFLWEQPIIDSLPPELYADVQHARNFSDTMWGATLLYNLMLAQLRDEDNPRFRADLSEWAADLGSRWDELCMWAHDTPAFWNSRALITARIPWHTHDFVERWLHLVYEGQPKMIAENQEARRLISNREWTLKRNRARLHNDRALDQWSGASGYFQIDYRWRIASRILNDIFDGLEGGSDDA